MSFTKAYRKSSASSDDGLNSKQGEEAIGNNQGWFKRLLNIDDLELKRICGTDAALYLIYLRYCSIFFFISKIDP